MHAILSSLKQWFYHVYGVCMSRIQMGTVTLRPY